MLNLSLTYVLSFSTYRCAEPAPEGIVFFYWTPFLWFDIIEELLKELLLDRYYVYGKSRDFTEIDCFIETRSGKEIWGFSSFVSKLFEDKSYTELMNRINMSGGVAVHKTGF